MSPSEIGIIMYVLGIFVGAALGWTIGRAMLTDRASGFCNRIDHPKP